MLIFNDYFFSIETLRNLIQNSDITGNREKLGETKVFHFSKQLIEPFFLLLPNKSSDRLKKFRILVSHWLIFIGFRAVIGGFLQASRQPHGDLKL